MAQNYQSTEKLVGEMQKLEIYINMAHFVWE